MAAVSPSLYSGYQQGAAQKAERQAQAKSQQDQQQQQQYENGLQAQGERDTENYHTAMIQDAQDKLTQELKIAQRQNRVR